MIWQGRRGMIMGMSSENGYEKLVAKVPLKEMSLFHFLEFTWQVVALHLLWSLPAMNCSDSDVQEKLMKEFEANENKDDWYK